MKKENQWGCYDKLKGQVILACYGVTFVDPRDGKTKLINTPLTREPYAYEISAREAEELKRLHLPPLYAVDEHGHYMDTSEPNEA